MKSKTLQSIATVVTFFCTMPAAKCFASHALPEVEITTPSTKFDFSERMEEFSKKAAQKLFVVQDAKILSAIAYTNTDFPGPWTDEKVVLIPEGWSYFSHSYRETTGLGSRKVLEPWFVHDSHNPSRITEVHVKVEAFDYWFSRSAVGGELDVVIVPQGTFPCIQE